mmetsp:Transcript_19796/g.45174  ORF Transcript_19796/g.45174 Transcript_19796/m.45174 type:complete len:319 (+) Transcript_19796:227-1183(+)
MLAFSYSICRSRSPNRMMCSRRCSLVLHDMSLFRLVNFLHIPDSNGASRSSTHNESQGTLASSSSAAFKSRSLVDILGLHPSIPHLGRCRHVSAASASSFTSLILSSPDLRKKFPSSWLRPAAIDTVGFCRRAGGCSTRPPTPQELSILFHTLPARLYDRLCWREEDSESCTDRPSLSDETRSGRSASPSCAMICFTDGCARRLSCPPMRIFTTSSCPSNVARRRAENPAESTRSVLAPLLSRCLTKCVLPLLAALIRGVSPTSSTRLIDALQEISRAAHLNPSLSSLSAASISAVLPCMLRASTGQHLTLSRAFSTW